jgi:hypothetical protein
LNAIGVRKKSEILLLLSGFSPSSFSRQTVDEVSMDAIRPMENL